MIGIKIRHPWIFFITFPILDLIFVGWLEVWETPVSLDFLPAIAALWIVAICLPEFRWRDKDE